ncbi:hypothetical protein [Asticcacaulis solisilvae]|uniref:hypothetical protein n=1 Tax=Asticcacaulis solisilvae TaxID=1217274 RepID=UPI003FD8544A
MRRLETDGAVFLSELADDAELRSDILAEPVRGRDAISKVFGRLDSIYTSQSVTYEQRDNQRDYRICKAVLSDGSPVEITTVALRDTSGWVSSIAVAYYPLPRARALAIKALSDA